VTGRTADDPAEDHANSWRAPSRRLLWLRRTELGGAVLPFAAGLAVAGALAPGVWLWGAVPFLVLATLGVDWSLRRRLAAWGYAEREDDLLVRRGVLVRRTSVVPYGRMQFVDVTAGPLDRRFALATVHLHTAAAASDARVPGLPRDEAERLRDRLAALGEARAAGR
jgi:membrane protein YdbS with pleckstrin-like domain